MIVYLAKARGKATMFVHFALLHIPRDQNSHANALANLASALVTNKQQTKVQSVPSSVLDEESPAVHCVKTSRPVLG